MTPEPEKPTAALIAALKDEKIPVAGWGFDPGIDPAHEAHVAAKLVKDHGLTHYVADIEQDEHDLKWTTEKIPTFFKALRKGLPAGAQVVVSSYPYIGSKHPELMQASAPFADAFAPQIYWVDHPQPYMLEPRRLPPLSERRYVAPQDLDNPTSYADLCLDWWRDTVGQKPLILTGQAYWERGCPRERAEAKLEQFLVNFQGWSRVVGAKWWHLGHNDNTKTNGAMTPQMYDALVKARVHEKLLAAA